MCGRAPQLRRRRPPLASGACPMTGAQECGAGRGRGSLPRGSPPAWGASFSCWQPGGKEFGNPVLPSKEAVGYQQRSFSPWAGRGLSRTQASPGDQAGGGCGRLSSSALHPSAACGRHPTVRRGCTERVRFLRGRNWRASRRRKSQFQPLRRPRAVTNAGIPGRSGGRLRGRRLRRQVGASAGAPRHNR